MNWRHKRHHRNKKNRQNRSFKWLVKFDHSGFVLGVLRYPKFDTSPYVNNPEFKKVFHELEKREQP